MAIMRRIGLVAATLSILLSAQAWANDVRVPFLGVWRITKAVPAPWTGGTYQSDPFLAQRWIGQRVVFGWNVIDAPYPLGCDAPDYHVVEVAPQELFQGNLTSPILQAHALGFRAGAPVRTLQTDCEHLIDFHFADNTTAMFALDNMIYTLRRR